MALARVQATGKVVADNAAAIALTFATPPSIGHGIVLPIAAYDGTFGTGSCTDTQGNTYTRALTNNTGSIRVAIYVCAAVAATGAPFTITVTTGPGAYLVATAIAVSGVGTGLTLDQTTTHVDSSTTVTTGVTAPLTAAEVLAVAVWSGNVTLTANTVEAVSPAWTEEADERNFAAHAVGESDSRILTGVLGTTTSCSWTVSPAPGSMAALATFAASGAAAPARAEPFLWLPV